MNRKNLLLLCQGVLTDSRFTFDMADYRRNGVSPVMFSELLYDHNCGTVACFAGHGPSIPGLDTDLQKYRRGHSAFNWPEYVKDKFQLTCEQRCWLFAAEWRGVDNTREGAVARALFLLERMDTDDDVDETCALFLFLVFGFDATTYANYVNIDQLAKVRELLAREEACHTDC